MIQAILLGKSGKSSSYYELHNLVVLECFGAYKY